jgi:hypothetical protein
VDELISPQGVTLQKSEFQKIIDEANRHMAEKIAAEKAEEERRRAELEKEEQEAAEAKAKERAERKEKREQRQQKRLSEPDARKTKSRLEKEMEIQVCPPSQVEVNCSFRVMFQTPLRSISNL